LVTSLAAGFLVSWQSRLIVPATSPLTAAAPASDYVLKLNGAITPSSAGVLIAISDGLFQREGLTLQLQRGTGDADVISTVARDEHVLGLASAEAFLRARAAGQPVVAFAASYILSSVEFFALSGTRLQSPADLEGKRIGYKPDSEISIILYAFIATNAIAQSGMAIVESDHALSDLREGRIDVLIGHREVEGHALDNANVSYRSFSPNSFGVHSIGPVYFANERAFSSPRHLQKILTAIANGWDAAYANYDRIIPIIARSIDERLSSVQISRFMDAQRRLLRPSGARFGELDPLKFRILQGELMRQRIIEQPLDLARAVNYDMLTDVYRARSANSSRFEP
jgi:ABC-type nitrate/sulfonate/bicarbonate transport system substrate-binding protein